MRFAELLCHAIRKVLNETGLGVRLSPVALDAEEARAFVPIARALLGEQVYLAIAAPGPAREEGPFLLLTSDEEAAEKATFWRNHLDPDRGERLLYLSTRRWGREGGLHDTLRELREKDLHEAAAAWCRSLQCLLPSPLGSALDTSGVVRLVNPAQFCAFTERVLASEHPLQAAGLALLQLELMPDSRLDEDPVLRLTHNARWVRAALLGHERETKSPFTVIQNLRLQLRNGHTYYGSASAGYLEPGCAYGASAFRAAYCGHASTRLGGMGTRRRCGPGPEGVSPRRAERPAPAVRSSPTAAALASPR